MRRPAPAGGVGDSEGGDSEGGGSEGGDSEGSDSEGGDSEGGDSEGGDIAFATVGALDSSVPDRPAGVHEPRHVPVSIVETVLVFVVAPLALYLAVSGLVLAPGFARRPRYRPGRSWRYEPVWFAAPEVADAVQADGHTLAAALGGGSHAALPAAGSRRIDTSTDRPGAPSGPTASTEADGTLRTARGGARGTW